MLKRLLFGWFLLPAISRPECFELTDVPVGSKLQNKLKSVIQVLHYTSMEKTFDRTSPFFYLNDFIKGHTLKINSMFENMLNDWFYERNDLVGNLKIYINNHVRKSVVTSSSIEELKKYQILSPICISTKDVELIFHLCMESTFFQTCEDVPKAILENLQEIQSWNRKNYRDEKFIIMNHKSLNLDEIMKNIDALVSSNNESKNNATQRTSQLLKHVLLSVDSIERICSELKYLGEDDMHTFLQLLKLMDSQERNDGSIERCVISCYIQELVQELKTSSENQTMDDLINNVMKDAELWDENIQLMITKHKKLLRILHSVELQVNELEKERKTADDIFDNISVGELINEIDFKQFVKDFLKSAFLEDQKKLIKNQFSAKRAEIFNMLKEVKVPEHQLERIEKFLQKTIMSKIYRQMVPRIFDNTNPSQRQLFNKEDNLLGTKISLLFDVEPLDFGISQKYSKVCDSKMAQLELRKLDTFIMPEEKVKVIVHCCSILIETMKISGNSYNIDDLLILLVYNIVRSNTPYLYSHLIYCKRFCGVFLEASKQPQVLSGIPPEHEYWFNQFETAVQFLLDFNVEEALMTPTTTNTANSSQQILHSKKRMSSKPSISSVHSREGNTSMMSQFSDQQPHTNTNSIDSFTASSTCELFEGNSNEEVDMIHFYKNNKITQVDETIMEADEVNTSPMIFMKSHKSFISGGNILNNKSNRELSQVGTFEHTKLDDLKHSEISKLLSEYKQLLTFYKDHAQTSQEQV
ncbi:hypothetical protein C9374_002848 [Naegleria lovaniensis]|uniref:VPS9 domain-containing protein n=1 Tax=Naegleria lovaniensis TaxID=51637 RepID=A0AA88GSU8_NAELO|nr:uncharacterized protein C9374_002848 [Naegleria lovaniensis]KAG2386402.1 hypothetical protein C9374_002848 [Naegleria lovaniensis]